MTPDSPSASEIPGSENARPARLFVALSLPDRVIDQLVVVQQELHRSLKDADVRWVKRDNLHLTLRFLGNVARDRIPALIDDLCTAMASCDAPAPACAGLGCFPSPRAPRILWANVSEPDGRLQSITANVRDATAGFSAARHEARYAPHVTLGRCRLLPAGDKRRVREFVRRADRRRFGAWHAHDCLLMESDLDPAGARYRVIGRFAFRSTGNGDRNEDSQV